MESIDLDRISNLPESIRNHIVSFLPMVDAIRTSILSKPWRNVCSSLSNFDFDQQLFDEMSDKKTSFKESVSQLIDHRDESNVQSFKLSIDVDDSIVRHINSWISYVVQHNVKEFELCVISGKLVHLPCILFTSKTLTALCLNNIINLNLPSLVEFPVMKTLNLCTIKWSDDKQTNQLISSCPLLQELFLVDCSWNKSNLLVISAPNLKRLVLKTASPAQEVRISSTKICFCHYVGHPPDISLESLSSLLSVEFYFFPSSARTAKVSHKHMDDRVIKIFMGLQNVVDLMIAQYSVEILAREWDLLSKNSTCFGSIKILGLIVFSTKNQVQFVALFLMLFSKLRKLCIFFEENDQFRRLLDMKEYCQPQMSSDLGALEEITIFKFKGSDDELYLVSHLLEYGKALKAMRISYSDELDEDNLTRVTIREKIANFVKASPVATISYFHGL
ncbi:hypothetical protein ACHQM5_018845 [Ranunculus cassubicifolius]